MVDGLHRPARPGAVRQPGGGDVADVARVDPGEGMFVVATT